MKKHPASRKSTVKRPPVKPVHPSPDPPLPHHPPPLSARDQVKALLDEVHTRIPSSGHLDPVDPGLKQPWMESAPLRKCKGPCHQFREFQFFPRNHRSKDGYDNVCTFCRPISPSSYKGQVMDAVVIPTKGGRPRLGVTQQRVRKLLIAAAMKASRQQMPYDLPSHVKELESRLEHGVCELTGYPLNLSESLAADAPSIYLEDPARGMVYSNVKIVCWAMTCALGTWGPLKLRDIISTWKGGLTNAKATSKAK